MAGAVCAPTRVFVWQCWVNTKPLDGESDTKLRLAPKLLLPLLSNSVDRRDGKPSVSTLKKLLAGAEVWCEEPNDKVGQTYV